MITGYFTKVEIPEVRVGEDIKATIGFYALNPGAYYWKTFLVVDCPQLGLRRVLDAARELGQEGGRTKTYTLGRMPDGDVNISLFLFAHDDAAYNWSWTMYQYWTQGYAVDFTHLDSHYVFLSPAPEPEPDQKVLKYEILGEKWGGHIIFSPPALDAEGHYYKGTVVTLTAVVNPGYVFVKWRGEVDNPLSTSLTNTVTMSENRLVKAEFALTGEERLYPLEIDITPAAGGYVTTEPPPVDIANHFIDGTVGKFSEGTRVMVTAHPNAGYEFVKWSDEIQGGVSYNPTEWVSGSMTEHKAVKAHFRLVEVPPECSIDADCPAGYVCRNGVCVPEGEVPPITCSIDADCPTGYICQNGVCVPAKPPIPSWLIPVLIAGAAVLILVPAKKGK